MKRNRLTTRGFTKFSTLGIRPLNKNDQCDWGACTAILYFRNLFQSHKNFRDIIKEEGR